MYTQEQIEELKVKFFEGKKAFALVPTAGKRIAIERKSKDSVSVIWYQPKDMIRPLPVFVYIHGGAWIALDAILIDDYCANMAERIPAVVVNVNYKKLIEEPFPYPQEELVDTVKWLKNHAEELNIEPDKIVISGGSAGGHIAAGAAILLAQQNIQIAGQVLEFPFTDFTYQCEGALAESFGLITQLHDVFFPDLPTTDKVVSPCLATNDELRNVAPAVMIVGGKDALYIHGIRYAQRLEEAGVKVRVKEYPAATHGFSVEGMAEGSQEALEQKAMSAACDQFKVDILRGLFH